jgi:hypothetical protein
MSDPLTVTFVGDPADLERALAQLRDQTARIAAATVAAVVAVRQATADIIIDLEGEHPCSES